MQTKFQSKRMYQLTSVFTLVMIFFTFTQCVNSLDVREVSVPDSPVPVDGGNINPGNDNEGDSIIGEFAERGATDVAVAVADVGIKDFEQIYRSMQVVTGINPANHSSIRNTYGDLSTQLPNENSVKQFNSSIQFAIFKLGSEFCDVMMNNADYYNPIFTTINMGQTPNQVLNNNTGKNALAQDLLNHFWGENVQDANFIEQTKAELVLLINDLLAGENMTSSATTRKIAKGVCASVISTPQITML